MIQDFRRPQRPSSARFRASADVRASSGSHLLVVGGAEDRSRQKLILRRFVELSGGENACILVVAIASETPQAVYKGYVHAFSQLGARQVRGLLTTSRSEIRGLDAASLLDRVTGVYFSGGDQLRIAALLGGTRFYALLEDMIRSGCTVGGTSAGASAISDTMIIGWEPSERPLAGNIRMSSGLGIVRHVVIDQHFSQRRRLSRLITAVSHHPGYLGVGVDEDTAALIHPDGVMRVIGSGTVTIVDGSDISDCNVAEAPSDHPLSVVGMKVRVLSTESSFDLNTRLANGVHSLL